MNTTILTGDVFARLVRGGAANLGAGRKIVNDLNVFPIPDGDTGDNMFMTIDSGAARIPENPELGQAASEAARGMLLGARGNSGVILSRIFAGISSALEGMQKGTLEDLARAFVAGSVEAGKAVSVPVEGTILTVCRESANVAAAGNFRTAEEYFDELIAEARRSLDRTPDLLPVLKEAGVVDSGGAGLVYIYEGMRKALDGEVEGAAPVQQASHGADISRFTEDSVLEFGYCTEFLMRLMRSKINIEAFDVNEVIDYLNSVGDSVVCFQDGTIVKVHVHTMTPGDILNHMQQYGEFLTLKIENMTLQHSEVNIENRYNADEFKKSRPHKDYGLVTVAAGKGIRDTFTELGCDAVVDGGQSMNPSAEAFIKAFEEINADTILVFPNNKNIIMTAQQAADMYEAAEVRVVPTRTIGEGYGALSMLDTSSGDTDAIVEELKEVISGVVTGEVSMASRNTEMDGVAVRSGDYLGFAGGKIYIDSADRLEAANGLLEKLEPNNYDILIIVYGSNTPKEEAEALQQKMSAACPLADVILLDGGQPIYDYILILE